MRCSSRFGMLIAISMLVTGGCSQRSVKVDGSSTVYPITEAVAEEFRKEQPNVRVIVGVSGTGGGMKKFTAGEIDICDASREIKQSEIDACAASGVEYIEFEVAFDGLSVIVNPENDWCDCLTVEQLRALWQPESSVSEWSDLDPEWPDESIELFGPDTDSGTFEYFTEAIVGEARSSRADYSPSVDDNVLVRGIENEKYSLGYFGFAYYNENRERLKLVAVDSGDGNCVQPSQATVRDNRYKPLSRPLFVYVRKSSLKRPEVARFVEYYLASVGSLVPDVGYVPVSDDVAANNRRLLDEAIGAATAGL